MVDAVDAAGVNVLSILGVKCEKRWVRRIVVLRAHVENRVEEVDDEAAGGGEVTAQTSRNERWLTGSIILLKVLKGMRESGKRWSNEKLTISPCCSSTRSLSAVGSADPHSRARASMLVGRSTPNMQCQEFESFQGTRPVPTPSSHAGDPQLRTQYL